jgi:hypothetical protein
MTAAQLIECATHEAAHAAIARALGLRVKVVTIAAPDGGRTTVTDDCTTVTDDRSMRIVLATLAGRVATQMLLGRASSCAEDDHIADALLTNLGFRDLALMRRALLADVRDLVARCTPAINRLALLLIEHDTLTGAQIDELLLEA